MSIRSVSGKLIALLIVLLAAVPMLVGSTAAAPNIGARQARLAQANVDWMSADQAAQLDLGFPVLVPSWIPAPFGGAPSVQAAGGYYSLYWMIPGGAPTFLQITGEVGGAMPVGSPADLNVRLEVNASVNGYDAIHDVTSIYDNVWWIQGGVLYTVSSKNMTGTDSLSLANSLLPLQYTAPEPTEPPAPEPTPVSEQSPTGEIYNASEVPSANIATIEAWPSSTSTLRATHGSFADSGAAFLSVVGGSYAWRAPSVDSATTVEFTLVDDATGQVTAWSSIRVYPTTTGETVSEAPEPSSPPETEAPYIPPATEAPPDADTGTDSTALTTTGSAESDASASGGDGTGTAATTAAVEDEAGSTTSGGGVTSDGTAGPPMPRTGDGTGGPSLPQGGDGTGGIRQIVIP